MWAKLFGPRASPRHVFTRLGNSFPVHVLGESAGRGKSRGSKPEPALSIGVKSVDGIRSHANPLVADSSSALHWVCKSVFMLSKGGFPLLCT